MSNRLTQTPSCWFAECKYCALTNRGHERELLDKAKKLCRNHDAYHFAAYLTAEFDRLDHAILDPIGQVEILNAVHDMTGCPCLKETIETISEQTKLPQVTLKLPVTYHSGSSAPSASSGLSTHATPISESAQNPTHAPRSDRHAPRKPSTILDRLKVGPRTSRSTR